MFLTELLLMAQIIKYKVFIIEALYHQVFFPTDMSSFIIRLEMQPLK